MTDTKKQLDYQEIARQVIHHEAHSLSLLADQIDDSFDQAVVLILACQARVVFSGLGKGGLIAVKLAATFASTGTPAFYMHPAEAAHGDLGMITPGDVVVILSQSGGTEELVRILPAIQDIGAPIIAITSRAESALAKAARVILLTGVTEEADPNGLAPTSSTTAMLALGDALAMAVAQGRGFTRQDFFRFHPGGALGALGRSAPNEKR